MHYSSAGVPFSKFRLKAMTFQRLDDEGCERSSFWTRIGDLTVRRRDDSMAVHHGAP
jgi:hypothetical protein